MASFSLVAISNANIVDIIPNGNKYINIKFLVNNDTNKRSQGKDMLNTPMISDLAIFLMISGFNLMPCLRIPCPNG